MTELLRQVVAEIEQLPEADQDAIAQAIQIELDERQWDALFATPASERFLADLADKIRWEDAAGETREIGDCQ